MTTTSSQQVLLISKFNFFMGKTGVCWSTICKSSTRFRSPNGITVV